MKRAFHIALGATAIAAGTLAYGALVEARRLTIERRSLWLRRWPARLDGYRIAFLADFHLRDAATMDLASRAILASLEENPNAICLGGDYVERWDSSTLDRVQAVFSPLGDWNGPKMAVLGNHEYKGGEPEPLIAAFEEMGVRVLRNELERADSIQWVGVDSTNAGRPDPLQAFLHFELNNPCIALWHEPDSLDAMPPGPSIMLSGHSHGGQFVMPWGWAPLKTKGGRKYVRGFYDMHPTPIYVTRGLGTTGPPSRLFCPPELAILTLRSLSEGS